MFREHGRVKQRATNWEKISFTFLQYQIVTIPYPWKKCFCSSCSFLLFPCFGDPLRYTLLWSSLFRFRVSNWFVHFRVGLLPWRKGASCLGLFLSLWPGSFVLRFLIRYRFYQRHDITSPFVVIVLFPAVSISPKTVLIYKTCSCMKPTFLVPGTSSFTLSSYEDSQMIHTAKKKALWGEEGIRCVGL